MVLSAAGMDFGAVVMATCLAPGLACFVMRLWANFPIALGPAMGHNFCFGKGHSTADGGMMGSLLCRREEMICFKKLNTSGGLKRSG